MIAYRFKVTFENQDEFVREVEFSAEQSFLDFYHWIIDNLKLDNSLPCSFFLCDHKYRKKKEIAHPTLTLTQPRKNQSEETPQPVIPTMDKGFLNEFIDDPHQKFLFIYDLVNDWNFFIELIKILPTEAKGGFPKTIKTIGATPVELLRKNMIPSLTNSGDQEGEMLDGFFEGEEPDDEDLENELGAETAEEGYDEEELDEFEEDPLFGDGQEMDGNFDDDRQ